MVNKVIRTIMILLLLTSCGSFEDPTIVLDLRILGISASPPEIVKPIDDKNENIDAKDINFEFDGIEVCALVADPGAERKLRYTFGVCPPKKDGRCDDIERSYVELGSGVADDPEESESIVSICQTLENSAGLITVIEESVALDSLAGFGGIAIQTEFYVYPEQSTMESAIFGSKRILFSPLYPKGRVANTNPFLDEITITNESGLSSPLILGRCRDLKDTESLLEVIPGEIIELLPIEPDSIREEYVLPTFDGEERKFTENITYNWYATNGRWGSAQTGGTKDFVGQSPPLENRWQAPSTNDYEDFSADSDLVDIWVVLKDERGGQAWYQSCVKVNVQQ